MGIPGNI